MFKIKTTLIRIILILVVCNSTKGLRAQAPSWSVNSNQFQYSMIVSAVIELNCEELTHRNNQIAAFVGDSVRGTSFTIDSIAGRFLVNMSVYSDTLSGERVKFRFYDQLTDSIYFAVDSLIFTDNSVVGNPANPIAITNNNAPSLIAISSDTLVEKLPVGSIVGSLTTSDLDLSQTHNYSLVNGTGDADNASFSISGNDLIANISADYVVKTSYQIRLRTMDIDSCTLDSAMTIFVKDLNDAPTAINLSSNQIDENLQINSEVGLLSAIDSDANEVFVYSLATGLGGADNSNFNIVGDTLRINSSFNFEVKSSYSIRLRVTDKVNNTFEDTVKVLVNDVNDLPTDVLIDNNSVVENADTNTMIGLLSTIDEDVSQSFTYTFDQVTGNNNSSFLISGNELRVNDSFDFESKSSYVINLESNDNNGGVYKKQLNISIRDTNEIHTNISLSSNVVTEKQAPVKFVGKLDTQDEDQADTYTYSLVAGLGDDDNSDFTVQNDSLFSNASFDALVNNPLSIRLNSTDQDNNLLDKVFSIIVIDTNDVPSNIIISNNSFSEFTTILSNLATITAVDQDTNDVHSYSLVAGQGDTDNSLFVIINDKLLNNNLFDFETQSTYSIRMKTTDRAGTTFEKTFTIQVQDENEKPVLDDQFFFIEENNDVSVSIGRLVVSDVDASETLSFRVIESTSQISLNEFTGEILSSISFDFETQSSYSFNIEVKDKGGLRDTAKIDLSVQDQIENTLPSASYLSPNGDGFNDTWSIANVWLYSNYSLKIFATNGEVVLDLDNNYDNSWDGTIGGSNLPEGVYYYLFESLYGDDIFKGIITLKR